ncbi:hypothetical protein PLICRDRAFT_38606 [Plicaturopsis crispa FD-325 SS-3]|nr:hypothetical protein PLICRDRAFT_38606 [Plicaturopsis crispa FD-325 SS-3]
MLRNAIAQLSHSTRSVPRRQAPLNNLGSSSSCRHAYSSASVSRIADAEDEEELDQHALWEAERRKRKTEWKRRQRGQSFLDHVVVNIRGGKGGDGCVAFHREKFKPFGPPSGGNGGHGGAVHILPTPHLTTLSSVPKRIRGVPGGNGQGTWQNGRAGPPTVIRVPLGTVVREIPVGDPRRAKDEWEAEEEALAELSEEDKVKKRRERRWVHYPLYEEANQERDSFKDAEKAMARQERERKWDRRQRAETPLFLDLDKAEDTAVADDAPLGTGHREPLGHLVASGGIGGLGNPHFLSQINRSPKFATRGHEGERVTLELELKLLADVGLVGMPNAGKSTLLRALTGGRVKSEVASYAFTTLNPVVGIVRVAEDGTFEGNVHGPVVYEDTVLEQERERALMASGAYADALTRNQAPADVYGAGHRFDIVEAFRFTIADNPGLISRASENVGLGHSFLRSMERSLALVYVVDLSGPAPWDELRVLREELEKYQPGMSGKARMVIANKADLLAGDNTEDEVVEARAKLARLEDFVRREMGVQSDGDEGARALAVVPTSARHSQNLTKVVGLMRTYVQEARDRIAAEQDAVEDEYDEY